MTNLKKANWVIDGKSYSRVIEGSPEYVPGEKMVISSSETDISFGLPWYREGFEVYEFFSEEEFENLKSGIEKALRKIVSKHVDADLSGFTLEKYHHFVKSDEVHYKVVKETRDLYEDDFNFPIDDIHRKLSDILGFELSDINPDNGSKMHVIIRVNRPNSNDYNPPHKDSYRSFHNGNLMKFINFWIPIAGVNEHSSLPIVPKSHLIPENEIMKTTDGGVVEGNKYRVHTVLKWSNSNELSRAKVKYKEVLVFSSHLIHGFAVNANTDMTRIALEFRLFKNNT